ncbi:MAG: hypothetical protein RI885_1404 [Actinomycetota bacterium]|jgi:hypothetical protein
MLHELIAHDGLILPSTFGLGGTGARALARDVDRGLLVKLRRGAFVESSVWESSSLRDRHILRVRAVVSAAQRPVIVAGLSAAALWGMPIDGDWPTDVTLLDQWKGGGRSEPGVRRTASGFVTATSTELSGIAVTTLARTAVDVARCMPFSLAMGSLDWALWRNNPRAITHEDLVDELARYRFHAGRRRVEAQLSFATHLSDSYGESECRAVIYLLGFEIPELQLEVRDGVGLMRPDFTWPGVRRLGEFDGKLKYTCGFAPDGDIAEIVWQEKKREDRLRRLGYGMSRFTTSDVKNPRLLQAILQDAGIPRRA